MFWEDSSPNRLVPHLTPTTLRGGVWWSRLPARRGVTTLSRTDCRWSEEVPRTSTGESVEDVCFDERTDGGRARGTGMGVRNKGFGRTRWVV